MLSVTPILVGYRELNVHDGKLYALSSAGAKKWEALVGDMQQRRATIDAQFRCCPNRKLDDVSEWKTL